MVRRERRKFIGLNSSTSCDGVDAVLIEVQGTGLEMHVTYLDHCSVPYEDTLREELLKVATPAKVRAQDIAILNMAVGYVCALAVRELMAKARVTPAEVVAVGSPGHTICRRTGTGSGDMTAVLQIGESSVIAAQTGVTVIEDFRMADVAVGGQGAPLMPWTDLILFRDASRSRCVHHIGEMAGVTFIPAGANLDQVVAFDTGPGNFVIDALVQYYSHKKHRFDPAGQYASRGQADRSIVEQVLKLPYFLKSPPKLAGRDDFGRKFVRGMLRMMETKQLHRYDKIATATLLTACSIAEAYRNFLKLDLKQTDIIFCGGGVRNAALMHMLRTELPGFSVRSVDECGIPLQAKTGVHTAMLAAARIDEVPANLPRWTGAHRPVLLGKIVCA